VQAYIVEVSSKEVFMLETRIACQKEEVRTALKMSSYQEMILKLPSQRLE
jgi:hypothetical protein